jgi:DNA adenine methylase
VHASPPTDPLKPPLKWAGGKRWLVPHLQPCWQPYRDRRYVEPFCGGLAMALGLRPERALLNDVNRHVVYFYQWLQRGLSIDTPMANDQNLYYRHRQAFNDLIAQDQADSQDAAAYFYYLNRTGYNGLCRFNRSGQFNVPFGQYRHINYTTDFSAYIPILRDWTFTTGDFERMPLAPDDFVYADPPYDVEFVSYSKEGFTWDDQVRLAQWLARHPGPTFASNQATERVVKLYQSLGFTLRYFDAPRRISSDGDRRPARELLAARNITS